MTNYDLLTKHEAMQLKAYISYSLGDISEGQQRAASKRRKQVMEARTIIELEIEQESQPNWDLNKDRNF